MENCLEPSERDSESPKLQHNKQNQASFSLSEEKPVADKSNGTQIKKKQ